MRALPPPPGGPDVEIVTMGERKRILIMGAGGRDFHLFNTVYRDDPEQEVVAFTATQIPGIDERRYPPVLSGPLYPDGIDIGPETELEQIVSDKKVDEVVFAYSDVPFTRELYKDFRINTVAAPRAINCDPKKRGKVTELIARNY